MSMEWLVERFAGAKEAIAFVHHNSTPQTYGTIARKIDTLTKTLAQAGVSCGATVTLVADYSPDVFCMILALARLRCIVVPMTHGSVIETEDALAVSGCDTLIEFSDNGSDWQLSAHQVTVTNSVLDEFRQQQRAGLVLFSSGSTGKPKGMLHDFERVAEKFRKMRQPVVAIPFLMLDHFGGINTLLAITASLGTVVTTENRSIHSICSAIEKYQVDLLPTTPSFLTMLVAAGAAGRYDLSSLKRITYGTETMPQATLDRVRTLFPQAELQQTYGLSEVGVLRSQSRPDGSLWVRLGGDGFETKVVDDILWIRSSYRMVGYLNAPSGFDAEGWFNTQDRVEVDGEYFRILGRVTDLINVAGQKVYPAEVENVILGLDNISEAVVVGEANPLLGQIVVARVNLIEPEPLANVRARVRKACLDRLAAYKVPAKVVLQDRDMYSARFKKLRK